MLGWDKGLQSELKSPYPCLAAEFRFTSGLDPQDISEPGSELEFKSEHVLWQHNMNGSLLSRLQGKRIRPKIPLDRHWRALTLQRGGLTTSVSVLTQVAQPESFQAGLQQHHCSLRGACLKTVQNEVGAHNQAMGSCGEQRGDAGLATDSLGYICLLENQLNVSTAVTVYSEQRLKRAKTLINVLCTPW